MTTLAQTNGYGLASARPAAGMPGRTYFSTDVPKLERDNGTSWDNINLTASISIGGSNTQVQFNDSSNLGGSNLFTFDKSTGRLFASKVKSAAFERDAALIVTDATTARTLSAADNGKIIRFTNSSDVTVTFPSGLGAGFSCALRQAGTGAITTVAGAGVTLRAYANQVKTSGQWAVAFLSSEVADEVLVEGQTTVASAPPVVSPISPVVELGQFTSDPSGGKWLKNLRSSQTPDDNIYGQSSYNLSAIGFNSASFTATRNYATGPTGVASSATRFVAATGSNRTGYLANNTGARTFPAGQYTLVVKVKANNATTQTVRFGCANSGTGTYTVDTAVTNAAWKTLTCTITKGSTAAIQPVLYCASGDPDADFIWDEMQIYPGSSAPSYATERATYDGHLAADMKIAGNIVISGGFVDNTGDKKPGVIKLAGYPAKTSFTEGTLIAAVNVTQNNANPAKIISAPGNVNGVWDVAIRNGKAYATPAMDLNGADNGTFISGTGTRILSVTFKSTEASFYLDGALIKTVTGSYGPFSMNQLGFMGDPMSDNGNASTYAINPVLGKVANARVYNQFLTDAEHSVVIDEVKSRILADTGVALAARNYWIAEGDSLTTGISPYTESYWDQFFATPPSAYMGVNMAAIGNTLTDLQGRQAVLLRRCQTAVAAGHRVIVSVWVGANAIPDQTQLLAYYDAIRATGAKVIAFTLTPNNKSTLPGGVEGYNTARLAFNTWLRTQSAHYDALADLGADASVGARTVTTPDTAPNAYCNDYVHFKDTGYTVINGIVWPLVTALSI